MAVKASNSITLSSVVDVKAVYRYYLLQSSTLSIPSKPTTNPPPNGWDDVEPTYTDGSTMSLYTVDLTVFSDDTWVYSEVSLSSSYEAAKVAYNKAQNAQDTANKAQEDVEALAVRVTTAETNITQNLEQIALRAKKTEVVKYINDIEIGGRNLLKDSNRMYECLSSSDYGSGVQGFEVVDGYDLQRLIGKTLTFSYFVNCPGERNINAEDGFGNRFGMYGIIDWLDADGNKNIEYPFTTYLTTSHTNERVSMSTVVTKPEGYERIDSIRISFQPHAVPAEGNTAMWKIGLPKLEIGNKATDWSPAPEESATKEDVTSLESSFTVEADGIRSEVEAVQKSVDENSDEIARANSLIQQLSAAIVSVVQDDNGATRLVQTSTGWEYDFSALTGAVQDHTDRLNNFDDKIKIGQYTNEDGETEPSIEFYESSTDFKVVITNKRILFQEGGNTPTYIFDNTLVTESIEVKQELKQGGWVQEIRDGCLCLVWKGVTE